MSELKNIPRLRFPDFYSEWVNNRLGDLIDIKGRIGYRGYTTNDIVSKGEGSISLSPSNIDSDGNLSYDNSTYITWEKYFESPEIMVEEGFTILVKTGSSFGKSGLIKDLPEKSTINPQLVVLKPTKINPFFLYTLTTLGSVQKQIKTMVVGGTIPTLSQENISNFNVNIPSLPEQQKIADFLTAVDKRIELLEKKKTLLETYKKGVMKKIFNQEIRFKDNNGKDFPNWEEKRLAEVSESISVKNHQIPSNNILSEGNIPVIDQGKDMVKGFSNQSEKTFRTDGVVVFGDHTTILKYIDFDFIVGGDGVKLISSNTIDMKYLYYNMVYNNVSTEGYKRHFSILKNIMIQIPFQEEQVKISEFLSSIDNQIELLVNQIDKSKTWKKGLLQKMFV